MSDTLIKQPGESRVFSMDFSPLLASGENVTSVTSVTVDKAGLTLVGNPTFTPTKASQRISGGTADTVYKVTYVVATDQGNTLESEGLLQVVDL